MQEELVWGLAIHCHCSLHPVDGDCAEEVGINHVYVNKCMLSRIANSILLKRIQKVYRGVRYLPQRTFCSSTTFEGTGEDAPSETGLQVWSCAAENWARMHGELAKYFVMIR